MPLITLDEVKGILQLTEDQTYDETIETLIPFVTDQVVYSICQNTFKNLKVYTYDSTISFDADNDKILDSNNNFIENDFISGIDIIVEGSLHNDGLYEVSEVAAGELTISFEHTYKNGLTTEAAGESILITKVEYPSALKVPTAMLINYLINKDNLRGIKSESVISYSVTYLNDLPNNIKAPFNNFRKLSY